MQFDTEDAFVDYILENQPEALPYFAVMKHVNKHGPGVLGDKDGPEKIDVTELADTIGKQMVLDARAAQDYAKNHVVGTCLLYTSPSPRDATLSRMPSSA